MRFAFKFSQLLVLTILLSFSVSATVHAMTDDFERATLGANWAAHADMVILNGKLHYQGSVSGWKYAAVYKGSGVTNPNNVSITYSDAATDPNYAGVLFVNSASSTANGYMVYKSGTSLRLFKITNGEVPASGYELASKNASPDVALNASGTLKVVFKSSNYSFDIYVNGTLVGNVADPTPGHAYDLSTVYAGVMAHGDPTRNKDVETFIADFVPESSGDTTAPSAISSLAIGTLSANSVQLNWTATSDNVGVTQYDVRYSTAAITNVNFGSATPATGEPTPKASGLGETFTVTGLAANTTYYFAIRAGDAVPNWSAVTFSPAAKTAVAGGGGITGNWKCGDPDGFNRATIGSDWSAPNFTIKNAQLATAASGDAGWNNLAVYIKTGLNKTPKFDSIKVSFKIGANAEVLGKYVPAAMAILLDTPSSSAIGYWLKRTDTQLILYKTNDFANPIVVSVTQPVPIVGDKVTAIVSDVATGKKINFYVNDKFDATINLPGVTLPTTWWAGVMEYGNTGTYTIDDFEVCYPGSAVAEASTMAKYFGDNLRGPINSTVTDSVAVLVKDDADIPVEGVALAFSVIQGQADLSVNNTATFGGKIWKECEAGIRGGYALEAADAGASGGKYITTEYINGTGTTPLTMTIYSPQDLVYDFWLRYRAPDTKRNAGYFKLDDKDSLAIIVPVSTSWAWYKAGYYTISRGVHTLKFFVKNKPSWDWDKIVLVDRVRFRDFIPTGTGGSGPYFSNVSNAQGIASTHVTFLSDADTNVVIEALGYKGDGKTLLTGAPVHFTLDPDPGPAAAIIKGSNQDTLKGKPGAQMTEPIQALILDSFGNRVSGVTVKFSLIRGQGVLSTAQTTSNSNGEANTYLTLSLLESFYEIQATATAGNGNPLAGSPLAFYVKPGVPPQNLSYISGNNQEGFSCDKLADPLIVKVVGTDGNPFSNYPVDFVVITGGGTVSATSPESYKTSVTINTNANGEARAFWKTGSTAGANSVEARATGLQGTPVLFSATGKADAAAVLKIDSGNTQTGPVGVRLDKPLVVKISDKCGENPISGFPVVFNVIQGTDAFLDNSANLNKPVTVLTNSLGKAQVSLYIGSSPNEQHLVRVTAAGMTPDQVTFTATAKPPVAIALEYVSGNLQDTTVTRPLSKPLVVRTKGPYNTVIGSHSVKFRITKGSGNFGSQGVETTVASNDQGLAQVSLTIGTTAGDSANIVEATSTRSDNPNLQLDGSPVRFIAAGEADLPSRVDRDETTNNQAAAAGATLVKDIRVRVMDLHGNPIANHNVTFEIQASGGTFILGTTESTVLVAKTAKDGYASTKWKMPVSLGSVRCIATVVKENGEALSGSPVEFTAISNTGDAYKMVKLVSADTLMGFAGKALEQRLRVRVTDRNDLPKGGYFVTFVATQGGGSVSNGLQSGTQQTVATSVDSGIAEVIWTLGSKSGVANNLVEARAAVTVNPVLVFKATTKPDVPSRLVEDKVAKDQVEKVGIPLPKPIKVQIVDQYGNGVPQHPVVFTVLGVDSLRGNIEGLPFKELVTDIDGWAQVTWTLGKKPGSRNNSLEVTSRNVNTMLVNSPYVFYATGILGDPALIIMESDTTKLSTTIGAALSEPLRVRVTDAYKTPYANQEVTFEVMSSVEAEGGSLDGLVDKKKVLRTDSYGLASVIFICGNKSGNKINRVEARSEFAGKKLTGSPVNFNITGRPSNAVKIMAKVGNGQSGTVGKFLANELQIVAMDINGNPVARHPITFRVTAGVAEKAALGADTLTTKVVETGPDGIAKVTWRLGRTSGADKNMVEATSTNGATALQGSPQIFVATAVSDITDGKRSKIEAFPIQAPADGTSRAALEVTLRDKYDNAVAKMAVIIDASGSNNIITQPMSTTDVNGQATGYIASAKAGIKWVKARDLNSQVVLADSVRVTFNAMAAFEIIKANTDHGDAQEANVGTALPTPLRVFVRDRNSNPIRNFPVVFIPTQGGGQMLDGPQVFTDSTGMAQARYLLGLNAGVNFIEARASDPNSGAALSNSPVRFTETGRKAQPSYLVKKEGDNQPPMSPGQPLANPLRVQVLDLDNQPIYGISVKFGVLINDGNVISTNPIKTDMNGCAEARVVVGRSRGVNMYSVYLPDTPAIQPVSFSAMTTTGEATRLAYVSGNDQLGTVNRTLQLLLTVRTEDAYGNAAAGVPVNFAVVEDVTVQSSGTLAGGTKSAIILSGADGIASIAYTPGTRAGLNKVLASSAGLQPISITFTVNGKADYPYCMTDASKQNLRGQINPPKPMVNPIQVLVTDQYGNPASGGIVQFVVMPQSGSLLENNVVYSNDKGYAAIHWTLGKLGENLALATASLPCGTPQITFRAQGESNIYPVLAIPGDQHINEDQQLLLNISATDNDGDQVYINAVRIPEGAIFDEPTGSHQFAWTPNTSQGRTEPYYAVFEALDSRGGQALDSVKIVVRNEDKPPVITGFSPSTVNVVVRYQDTQEFTIQATDPDGDQLYYTWKVDNTVVGNSSAFFFDSHFYSTSTGHSVTVEVFDQMSSVTNAWWVDIKTAVEMKTFTSAVVAYQGVKLQWETASEVGNLGFNVLRSLTEAGKYEKINAELIAASQDGKYAFIDKEAQTGQKYYYKIVDLGSNGSSQEHGPVIAEMTAPETYELSQNYPNPFNPNTSIRYQLPAGDKVRIEVYNLAGQLVRTVVDAQVQAGYHIAIWDGRNDRGMNVSSGVYYYRLVTKTFTATKKMALLK